MYILRQLNFHEILTQPVMKFVINLNGTDEDRKLFKESLKMEMEKQDNYSVQSRGKMLGKDVVSENSFQTSQAKPSSHLNAPIGTN
mmetsp:Transcript_8654/g.14665  ORF Transcript_8654/g.14665 Transcript_8654/m.14665 type:complete len:86 (+) Transcript_8654:1150-1407(+)